MKKILLPLLFITSISFAQVEAKVDVAGLLLSTPNIKAEYIFAEKLSAELSLNTYYKGLALDRSIPHSGYGFRIAPRYYAYYVTDECDGLFFSAYYNNQTINYDYETVKYSAVGIGYGYKLFLDSGFTIEAEIYGGGFLSSSVDDGYTVEPISKEKSFEYSFTLSVGYRFDWTLDNY